MFILSINKRILAVAKRSEKDIVYPMSHDLLIACAAIYAIDMAAWIL